MWETMSSEQQIRFITALAGSQSDRIDQNLVYLAEEKLRSIQRERYVDLLSAETSLVTYRGLSEAQIQSHDTTQRYYFNMLHVAPEVKARCLWYAVENQEP